MFCLKACFLILAVLLTLQVEAQIPLGAWRTHLPYNSGQQVAITSERVYCLTKGGIFYYHKEDQTVNRFSKIQGLSDLDPTAIAFSESNNVLMIGYENGNLDIIEENQVRNLTDIKRKRIPGSKRINDFLFIGEVAYLSTGFGIVVVDIPRSEIRETYYPGANGSQIYINKMEFDGQYLFAASEQGIYFADINSPNLIDFNNWSLIDWIPDPFREYHTIAYFEDILYTASRFGNVDSLYAITLSGWSYAEGLRESTLMRSLESYNEQLITASQFSTDVYDQNLNNTRHFSTPHPNHALIDKDGTIWIADEQSGLVKNRESWYKEEIAPKGPSGNSALAMDSKDGYIYTVKGGYNPSFGNLYKSAEWFVFHEEQWTNYNAENYQDLVDVVIDSSDPAHLFFASWGYGVLEVQDNELVQVYNEDNSPLVSSITGEPYTRIGGIRFDDEGRLWVANSSGRGSLHVLKKDGSWKSFDFDMSLPGNRISQVIVTRSGQKWSVLPRGNGIWVFDDQGTIDNDDDDLYTQLLLEDINGKSITRDVYCLAQDLDGIIWVGTDQGIVVYYAPDRVFTSDNFYAQQILIPRNDGTNLADLLLATELVSCITVDGGNRKWIGTRGSGAYLVSEDGQEEIHHFTTQNSPLLSDNINDIVIDEPSGEVFFATDKGIISYRGEATPGGEFFGKVYAFPNPVREDYDGDIVITGLVRDTDVKITDVAGNLVYETTSEGGQAVWNGKDLFGRKVNTGVYIVFLSNQDGSQTRMTKILVIN